MSQLSQLHRAVVLVSVATCLVGCAVNMPPAGQDVAGKSDQAQVDQDEDDSDKAQGVFAAGDIHEGQVISAEDLQTHEISACKIAVDALNDPALAIGRKAAYDIAGGGAISEHCLQPTD